MAEDPQPMTLQQRIAALNASHINRVPGDPPPSRPKPQIPPHRPVLPLRHESAKTPAGKTNGSRTDNGIGNLPTDVKAEKLPPPPIIRIGLDKSKPAPPPLPKRQSSQPCPALPPRRPAEQSLRRDSFESTSSVLSSVSGTSTGLTSSKSREFSTGRVKAPAWGECELPPLPQKQVGPEQRKYSAERPKYHNRAPSGPLRVSPTRQGSVQEHLEGVRPSLPPRLPARRQTDHSTYLTLQSDAPQNLPPVPSATTLDNVKRSALVSLGMNKSESPPPPVSRLINNGVHADSVPVTTQPPAIPIASRPDLSTVQGSKPRSPSMTDGVHPSLASEATTCMVCRDFSAQDHHATLFPRQGVRSLPTLAQQLTSAFASPTDKARTIFTWLHHNIRYDTESFFAGNVQGSTPKSTLQSGLAVCEGYAALFANLATHAGLESVVISGHGKGYGYTPLKAEAVLPSYNAGHAWNAVRIDHGEWKLVDACWGAGHVQGAGKPYVQRFEPRYFTMSNEEFGIKHFPGNKDMFFLPGGRRIEWEEYIRINPDCWPSTVEPPTVFSNARPDYGVGGRTVMPRSKVLQPSQGGVIRFSFELECPHWTLDRHTKRGAPPVFILAVHGVDGREKDYLALDHVRGRNPGGGGDTWFVDVEARLLGAPGQTLTLFAVSSFGDRQDARGLGVREFREGKGRVGMGFSGVAAWELV
jgi:transglutaminase-like putative cysteine protease